jgi:hypothetical protein
MEVAIERPLSAKRAPATVRIISTFVPDLDYGLLPRASVGSRLHADFDVVASSRKRDREHRRRLVALRHHGSVVRAYDFRDDVKGQTEPGARLRSMFLPERLEEMGQNLGRDRNTAVRDSELDWLIIARQTNVDRRVGAAMLNCIAEEIAANLYETIAIPAAHTRSRDDGLELTVGMKDSELLEKNLFRDRRQKRQSVHRQGLHVRSRKHPSWSEYHRPSERPAHLQSCL